MTREEVTARLEMMFQECSFPQKRCKGDCCTCSKAIDALQAEQKVAYACDGRRCGADCSDCGRTTDIEHAKNFTKVCDSYFEKLQTEPSDLISRTEAKKAICKACLNGESILRCKHKWDCPYLMALYDVPSDKGGGAEMNEAKSPFMQQTPSEDGSDLISRADAMSKCKNAENKLTDEAERKGLRVARFIIGEMPSADRPSGEWEYDVDADDSFCTNCHKYAIRDMEMQLESDFCPNCGARMEGGAE